MDVPEISVLVSIVIMALCALALMALEAFIPGVSIAGLAGAALIAASVYLCWRACGAAAGIILLIACGALSFLIIKSVYRSMRVGRLSKSGMFLNTESAPTVHRAEEGRRPAQGETGVARTALRPEGIAEFDGQRVHVKSGGGYIEPGAIIRIIRIEGSQVVVAPVE